MWGNTTKTETKIRDDLHYLISDASTTVFEKEKLNSALKLLSKGVPTTNVLRRLQVTFLGLAVSQDLKNFISQIPSYLKKVQILGTAFIGAAYPL